jgi:hypothetical protein
MEPIVDLGEAAAASVDGAPERRDRQGREETVEALGQGAAVQGGEEKERDRGDDGAGAEDEERQPRSAEERQRGLGKERVADHAARHEIQAERDGDERLLDADGDGGIRERDPEATLEEVGLQAFGSDGAEGRAEEDGLGGQTHTQERQVPDTVTEAAEEHRPARGVDRDAGEKGDEDPHGAGAAVREDLDDALHVGGEDDVNDEDGGEDEEGNSCAAGEHAPSSHRSRHADSP